MKGFLDFLSAHDAITLTTPPHFQLTLCRVLPELRVVAVNGDSLRYIKGIFKDKLHVLSRA